MKSSVRNWATRPEKLDSCPECVAFILVRDNQILAEQRRATKTLGAGKIAIPGGRVELGEHPLDALYRESNEELSIIPNSARYVCSLLYSADVVYRIHYYVLESWTGEIVANEAESLFWIPFSELQRFDYRIDRLAIGEYLNIYRKSRPCT